MSEVRQIDAGTSADAAMEILQTEGAVIYRNLIGAEQIARVRGEIQPYLERAYNGEGEFWGRKTKRVSALVAKSKSFGTEIATHPTVLAVMDRLLLPSCSRYQLHVTQAVHIGPGQGLQIIHRDDALLPFRHPGPQALTNTMWAMTDFTKANGATNVIKGSHTWDDDRVPTERDEISHAVMPAGSCMIYLGSVWHGGGRNETADEWRTGLISGYSLGWLRQEENQYLAVPPAVARDLPEAVQHLIGYKLHGVFLGWVEGQDPHVVLEDRYADVMPASPEGGEFTEDTRTMKNAVLGPATYH